MNILEARSNWIECPVYYEDTDFSGYVYHANYLKFFERGREHFLGMSRIKQMFQSGQHFVVAEIGIKYLAPARHGDLLGILTQVERTNGASLHMKQSAWFVPADVSRQSSPAKWDHHAPPEGSRLLSEAQIRIVHVSSDGKPQRIDDQWLSALMTT